MAFWQACLSLNSSKHTDGYLTVGDVTLCYTWPSAPPESAVESKAATILQVQKIIEKLFFLPRSVAEVQILWKFLQGFAPWMHRKSCKTRDWLDDNTVCVDWSKANEEGSRHRAWLTVENEKTIFGKLSSVFHSPAGCNLTLDNTERLHQFPPISMLATHSVLTIMLDYCTQ